MRPEPPVKIRMWNDWYAYKKAYVLQGFYELAQKRKVAIEWVSYEDLQAAGAPAPVEGSYQSHHNMVIFQIFPGVKDPVNVVYDCNDIYYKIPNALLRWSHLYYKSNFQEQYLKTGERLTGDYWDSLTFRENCLPEPLDLEAAKKCRPCSFSMRLTKSPRKNRRYLDRMAGAWQRSSPAKKKHDIFYLGSYWGKRQNLMDNMVAQIEQGDLRWLGGLVESKIPLSGKMLAYKHPVVSHEEWGEMASRARLPLMERGLDGCMSYKPAHYCLIGAPFVTMELLSNFWIPLRAGVNYLQIRDDFTDLAEIIQQITDEELLEMGRRNLAFWYEVLCPEATAHYILREAIAL